jgi:hypothetical protein
MDHREDRELTITLHLSATFSEDYEGDDDGFVWRERFAREVEPRLLAAIFDVLRSNPRFVAVPAPRGRDPETGVDIDVSFVPDAG